MLILDGLSKSYGGQVLFRDASLQLHPGHCYGVVGANGSGKSTLLRILAGEEEPGGGSFSIPRKCRVGVLRQDHFRFDDIPVLDVVMMGHAELWEAMQAKDALLAKAEDHFDAERYSQLEDVILRHDGYSLEARAAEILAGLNIPTGSHHQPLRTLSGGYKLRALLGQTLAADPDVLLLDEPTNHLDILSIRWLEKFLGGFKGCALVVSHDHRFLNNVCGYIIDVDYERVALYRGNYNDFVEAKRADRERIEAEIDKREQEIADHKAFVERFRAKPTKARQAKSRAKQIEKVVIPELPRSSRRYPDFVFKSRRHSGRRVLSVENVCKSFGERVVLERVSLEVQRGDRLAIIGPNGIGKSTLLKILAGLLPADRGEVEWGYETHVGYFPQNHQDLLGDGNETVQSWLWNDCPGESVGWVRNRLARVLFQKEEVAKKVSNLSGGEAARLIFARLNVTEPNVMLLDEPTNHLDLEGIESLAEGLGRYDGTLVFVSHDRWLVSQLATRILEIRSDGMQDFAGTYDEYLERCGDDHLDVEAVVRRTRREQRQARSGRG